MDKGISLLPGNVLGEGGQRYFNAYGDSCSVIDMFRHILKARFRCKETVIKLLRIAFLSSCINNF